MKMKRIEVNQIAGKLCFEAEGKKWWIEHQAKIIPLELVRDGVSFRNPPSERDRPDLDCPAVVAVYGALALTGNPQVYVSAVEYADGTKGVGAQGFVQAHTEQ
jgi:hypothetical protein